METSENEMMLECTQGDNEDVRYVNEQSQMVQRQLFFKAIDAGLDFKFRENVLTFSSFEDLMESIAESFPKTGLDLDTLVNKVKQELLPHCTNYSSPNAMAFPDSGNATAGIVGDILTAFLNQNLINWYPCSPVGTVVEMIVLNWFRELVGYPLISPLKSPIDVGGFITTGGVSSNTIALLLARERELPGTMKNGITSQKYSIIVPQFINHYSSRLSVGWLGLGENNVVQCPVKDFKYDLEELENMIRDLISQERNPFFLVGYAGDSRSLTCDNFKRLHLICQKYSIWLHVDGCHGTQLLFSQSLRGKLDGIELADSITFDPHKTLNLSYAVSLLLIRDPKHLELIRRPEDIITGEEHSFGQLTPFFGSRPFHSLKLYMLLKSSGLDGIGKEIERRHEMAKYLAEKVKDHPYLILINPNIDMHSVIFMYYPEYLHQKEISQLNQVNEAIQQELLKTGRVWLHTFTIPDLSNILGHGSDKMLRPLRYMSGNPILTHKHIDDMLEEVCKVGAKLCERRFDRSFVPPLPLNSKSNATSMKTISLRNNVGTIKQADLLSWQSLCERTTNLLTEIRKFVMEEFSDKEPFFVFIYGSYAYKLVRPTSDLDIVFCAANVSVERRDRIIRFVKDLHISYGMEIDNEVPYESKLLISFDFLQKACEGKGIFHEGKWNIPKIEKTKEYLSSEFLLLRFFMGVLVNPNLLVSGNSKIYQCFRDLAYRNLIRAILSINERSEVSSVSLVKDFCQSKDGEYGDYFLGFSYKEPFISYLVQSLELVLNQMKLRVQNGKSGPIYKFDRIEQLQPEQLRDFDSSIVKDLECEALNQLPTLIASKVNTLTPSPVDLPNLYSTIMKNYSALGEEFPTSRKVGHGVLSGPIFVVGCPRSGTTLVGSILSAHEKVVGSEESLFLLPLFQIFSDLFEGNNKRNWAPLQNYVNLEEIQKLIQNFSDGVFGSFCPSESDKRYVDHTPWYLLLMPFIKRLYPDCVFIHVIRNGIDVVNSLASSYKKGFGWCGSDTRDRSKMWSDLVKTGKQFGSKLDKHEYVELYYEKLCDEPELEIRSLLEKLNLEWDDKCLYPLAVEHAGPSREGVTMSLVETNENKVKVKSKSVSHFDSGRWTMEDKIVFLSEARKTMKICGFNDYVIQMKLDVMEESD